MLIVLASNEVLKLKFRKLHATIVSNVSPANVIHFLFQEGVIGPVDMRALVRISDPLQQCSEMLALVHMSENPQAFVQLYAAIKEESHLQWLIDRIDKFTDQSLIDLLGQLYVTDPSWIDLLRQRYLSEPTGERVFKRRKMCIRINNCVVLHKCKTAL